MTLFLMPFKSFFSLPSTRRVNLRTKANRLLNWLACDLVLHLSKNLKTKNVLSLMYNLYIVESLYLLVGDVEQRVIGWVVAEVKHVGVQSHVPVHFIALGIVEK